MQSDIGTVGPPLEKFAAAVPRQSGVEEKNTDTAAWPGEAYPNAAANITTDMRKIFVRFIFCLCTS